MGIRLFEMVMSAIKKIKYLQFLWIYIIKWINCVYIFGLLGDKSNQVHMEGYQVSNQCMALVRDNCLVPTKDAPELGYVRESTDKQYVPDVYYKVRRKICSISSRCGK